MTTLAPQKLLKINEFAAQLRVTTSCVRRWLSEGKISFVKLGRRLVIPASEVDRLIAEGTRPASREFGRSQVLVSH